MNILNLTAEETRNFKKNGFITQSIHEFVEKELINPMVETGNTRISLHASASNLFVGYSIPNSFLDSESLDKLQDILETIKTILYVQLRHPNSRSTVNLKERKPRYETCRFEDLPY